MHFIHLRIAGEKVDCRALNQVFGELNPVFHKQGNVCEYDDEIITFDENIWSVRFEIEEYIELNEKIENIINLIYKYSSVIKKMSKFNDVSFWLTLYVEPPQLNIRLSNSALKKLYETGTNLDISIMNLMKLYS